MRARLCEEMQHAFELFLDVCVRIDMGDDTDLHDLLSVATGAMTCRRLLAEQDRSLVPGILAGIYNDNIYSLMEDLAASKHVKRGTLVSWLNRARAVSNPDGNVGAATRVSHSCKTSLARDIAKALSDVARHS